VPALDGYLEAAGSGGSAFALAADLIPGRGSRPSQPSISVISRSTGCAAAGDSGSCCTELVLHSMVSADLKFSLRALYKYR